MKVMNINVRKEKNTIAPELHGQFIEFLGTCIYDGIWVGEDSKIPNVHGIRKDVLEAFQEIAPPVIRWPGGCYADTYHWRNGIGERTKRPVTYNENFGTYETDSNQFGTHEFMEFCKLVGAKPWLNINMMSGSVEEMREWMEYCNRTDETSISKEREQNGSKEAFGVELWGVGNEVWGGGGTMTAQGYATEYRKYATAFPSFAKVGQTPNQAPVMKRIASGPDGNKPIERVKWTKDFFKALAEYRMPPVDGYDLHFYNWNIKDMQQKETEFQKEEWNEVIENCMELEDVILEQAQLMEEGLAAIPEPEGFFPSPEKKIDLIVGEWGNWHGAAFINRPALFQQCTMRDAITTALTLDIFHRNSDKVTMACAAQTVNVLNSLILTDHEKSLRTPNFDVFRMYKVHRGGVVLEMETTQEEGVHFFASQKGDIISINLVNTAYEEEKEIVLQFSEDVEYTNGQTLTAEQPQDYNTFEEPDKIRAVPAEEPEKIGAGKYRITLKNASVNVMQFK